MKRLMFLMDSCNPGMVPDPEFLAASLDLVGISIACGLMFVCLG